MHSLVELKKQQIGLKLPKYLVNDIDTFTKEYSINRTDIIIEAIKSYLTNQKEEKFYNEFNNSCEELKKGLKSNSFKFQTLDEMIDEIENT